MTTFINSLPSEILSRIFSNAACSCASPRRTFGDARPPLSSPLTLSAVCKSWRHVALQDRLLWSHIDVSFDTKERYIRFPSPQPWLERSSGSSLHLSVEQYRQPQNDYSEEDNEDIDRMFGQTAPPLTLMVKRLRQFIIPLMPQVSSLVLMVTWPNKYILNLLVNYWKSRGTHGHAKTLQIYANPELSHLYIQSSVISDFFGSLSTLHLHNTTVRWPESAFSGLTELDIEMGEGHWALNNVELASLLAGCPKLERLSLCDLQVKLLSEARVVPASLQNLKVLRIGHNSDGLMLGSMFAVIKPGPNPLHLRVSVSHMEDHTKAVLTALRSFIQRANVATLHVRTQHTNGFRVPYFASQISPLPHVRTLVLDSLYFCEKIRTNTSLFHESDDSDSDAGGENSHIVTYENPTPIDPHPPLWPELRNLYLHRCYLDKDYTCRMLSAHPVQNLYMRNCFDELEQEHWFQAFDMRGPSGEEYARALSQIVPKIVISDKGGGDWPNLLN
ncbi:isoamyl alcohol oxidase [Ceratobasidium sp. AG-Ba]|nr:isoamyl alcohol oxidase [Ceratobasidium sp. AG-Ba]